MATPIEHLRRHGPALATISMMAVAVAWMTTRPCAGLDQRGRTGDEPHYLVMVNSLLSDHDLFLENNYANVVRGGHDAGESQRGNRLDPHAFLIDYRSGLSLKWHSLYDHTRRTDPAVDAHGMPYPSLRPNPFEPGTYHLVPSHPPAFSAMVAAVLLMIDPAPEEVERLSARVLIGAALLALFVGYFAGLGSGLSRSGSVAAVALFSLCSPWLAYTGMYFTEVTTSLVLLGALVAHQRNLPLVAGCLVVVAFSIKLPYALVGAAWVAELAWRRRWRDMLVLGSVLCTGTILLLAFNYSMSRTLLISGALPLRFFTEPWSFLPLLFGPTGGLLVFAPWAIIGIAAPWLERHRPAPSLYASMLLPIVLYFALLSLSGFTAGSYGCRYWVPFLPWLAILSVAAARAGRATRSTLIALALFGLVFAVSAALTFDNSLWGKPPTEAIRDLVRSTS